MNDLEEFNPVSLILTNLPLLFTEMMYFASMRSQFWIAKLPRYEMVTCMLFMTKPLQRRSQNKTYLFFKNEETNKTG